MYLKISQNLPESTCVGVSFDKGAGLKKRLRHRCFPVNVAKFVRTLLSKNTWRQLLLYLIFYFFLLKFTTDYKCGEIFRKPTGSFTSPNYDGITYPANANCLYIIDTPGYNRLTVYFQSFDVEKTSGCYKDYLLTLIDGKFPSTYAVEKDCGKDLSRKIFRDKAWFEFYSDGSVEKGGFKAVWRAETVTTTASATTSSTAPAPGSTDCLVVKMFTKVNVL